LLGLFDGADGLKTGHTSEAGYGLAATAERDGVRRLVVFNGMESERDRANEAERLMRAALSEFQAETLVEAGAMLAMRRCIWAKRTVSLQATKPF
jgi:D-alanyl-D-alanine carboxypeptidase (penicillin-binding protein 5/6)